MRVLIALVLVLSASMAAAHHLPPDDDGDGVPDLSDNCPFVPNGPNDPTGPHLWGDQAESLQYPGIGCACLCGDVNRDCTVNAFDAPEAQRAGLTPPLPPLSPRFDIAFCDINADGNCNAFDGPEMQRAGLTPPLPPISPDFDVTQCPGYQGTPVGSFLNLVDGYGNNLGPLISHDRIEAGSFGPEYDFFSVVLDAEVATLERTGHIPSGGPDIGFSQPGCQGEAYFSTPTSMLKMSNHLLVFPSTEGLRFFVPAEFTGPPLIQSWSFSRPSFSPPEPCNERPFPVPPTPLWRRLKEVTDIVPFSVPIKLPMKVVPAR